MQPDELRAVEEEAEAETEPVAILRLIDPIMQDQPKYTPHMETVVKTTESIHHRMTRMLGDQQVRNVVEERRGSTEVRAGCLVGYTVMARVGDSWCYFEHGAMPGAEAVT